MLRVVPLPLARAELAVARRLRKKRVQGGSEFLGANQGFALLLQPVPGPPAEKRPLRDLLLHVRALVAAKIVRRDFDSWAHAVDVRKALRKGAFYPGGPEGPVELKLLGVLALRPLDAAALRELCATEEEASHYEAVTTGRAAKVALLRGWKTWDLVCLAHLWRGRRPGFLERCLHYDPSRRPSVEECLRAFA
jgi:hypothetical protein